MGMIDGSLVIGAGGNAVRVRLTGAALELLHRFSAGRDDEQLTAHRALLTTIAVGKAADGGFSGPEMEIDDQDILQVLDHAGTSRSTHAVRTDRR